MEYSYEDALGFATLKHYGQYRKGGGEYITHPVTVAENLRKDGYPLSYVLTGLFHDLLEDTDATEDEILRLGGQEVLTAVKLLTKPKNVDMTKYIGDIKGNPIAFAVKKADRLHNLRCANRTDKVFIKQYIEETELYFKDFGKEIFDEVEKLKIFLIASGLYSVYGKDADEKIITAYAEELFSVINGDTDLSDVVPISEEYEKKLHANDEFVSVMETVVDNLEVNHKNAKRLYEFFTDSSSLFFIKDLLLSEYDGFLTDGQKKDLESY